MNTGAKEKARSGHSTGFIAVLILTRPTLAIYVAPWNKDVFNAIDAEITRGRCLAAVGHDDRLVTVFPPRQKRGLRAIVNAGRNK